MIAFIDAHRDALRGRADLPATLQVAPSHLLRRQAPRPPSARACRDADAGRPRSGRVHRANFGVYGVRKVWKAAAAAEGIEAGRDRSPG